jgi:hypothetical protein
MGQVFYPVDCNLDVVADGEQGAIKNRNYYGPDGMEHCRTKKEPKQPIPTFVETVALLMKVTDPATWTHHVLKPDSAREPTRQVQHRRESEQRADAALHTDARCALCMARVGNSTSTTHSRWPLAPKLHRTVPEHASALSAVIHRHRHWRGTEVFLERVRRILCIV